MERSGKFDKVAAESNDDANVGPPSPVECGPAEASLLAGIHTENKAMRSDGKSELHWFWATLREDMKKELTEFRPGRHRGDLKNTTT